MHPDPAPEEQRDSAPAEFIPFLHIHATNLVSIRRRLSQVLRFLGDDAFSGLENIGATEIQKIFGPLAAALASNLVAIASLRERGDLPQSPLDLISMLALKLQRYDRDFPFIHIPDALDAYATAVRESLEKLILELKNAQIKYNREVFKSALRAAQDIQRVCCIYEVHNSIELIESMDRVARNLHRRGRAGPAWSTDGQTSARVTDLVDRALAVVSPLASRRSIELRPLYRTPHAVVMIRTEEIIGVMAELLKNAIKYTGYAPKLWIDVRVFGHLRDAFITIESWGIPIDPDELELVFQENYRGRHAIAAGIEGTGWGLWNAHQVVKANGGELELDSRRSHPRGSEFTTTATVVLPLAD